MAARDLVWAASNEQVERFTVDPDDADLRRYLRTRLAPLPNEALICVFVDQRNRYVADEMMGMGGPAGVQINASTLFRRATDLRARGFLLAHNHPSADPFPSAADVAATRRIAALGRIVDYHVVDHLIVAGRTITSMRGKGWL